MKNLVAAAHAIADETRWRVVQLVLNEPLCVCEIADILDMPQSSVSSHVQVIRKAGLLDSEKCEKWVYYRVKTSFRPWLASMAAVFEVSPATDSVLKTDAKRALQRLSRRDMSCCPLPKNLSKLKPVAGKAASKSAC